MNEVKKRDLPSIKIDELKKLAEQPLPDKLSLSSTEMFKVPQDSKASGVYSDQDQGGHADLTIFNEQFKETDKIIVPRLNLPNEINLFNGHKKSHSKNSGNYLTKSPHQIIDDFSDLRFSYKTKTCKSSQRVSFRTSSQASLRRPSSQSSIKQPSRPKSQGGLRMIYTICEQQDPAVMKLMKSAVWKEFLEDLSQAQKYYEKVTKKEDQDGSAKEKKSELLDPESLRKVEYFVDKCMRQKQFGDWHQRKNYQVKLKSLLISKVIAKIEKTIEKQKNEKELKKMQFDQHFKVWQKEKVKKKEEVKMQVNPLQLQNQKRKDENKKEFQRWMMQRQEKIQEIKVKQKREFNRSLSASSRGSRHSTPRKSNGNVVQQMNNSTVSSSVNWSEKFPQYKIPSKKGRSQLKDLKIQDQSPLKKKPTIVVNSKSPIKRNDLINSPIKTMLRIETLRNLNGKGPVFVRKNTQSFLKASPMLSPNTNRSPNPRRGRKRWDISFGQEASREQTNITIPSILNEQNELDLFGQNQS